MIFTAAWRLGLDGTVLHCSLFASSTWLPNSIPVVKRILAMMQIINPVLLEIC